MSIGRIAVRHAIGGMVDSIVKIGNVIVANYMTGPCDFDGIFRQTLAGRIGIGSRGIAPSFQIVRIVSAEKSVVGDVEVLRSRPVGVNAFADIFEATPFD